MATVIHTAWLDGMLGAPASGHTGNIDFDTDTIDASLLDATDSGTITAATADYDEVDTPTVVANTGNIMSGGTVSGGVVTLPGAVTFSTVTGDEADYLTVWKDTATPSSSTLAITWDSVSTGLPVTPNSGDIVATWSTNILVTLA